MDCKGNHDLFEIARGGVQESTTVCFMSTLVCAYCGHTRNVYSDGRVIVVREQGEVSRLNTSSNVTAG